METNYRYIHAGRHYFCLEQSLILLTWMLISGRARLRLAAPGLSASDALKAIFKIALYRLGASRGARLLELPFFGNVCQRVHRGYKIFDFRRASVIKMFSARPTSGEVKDEITATVARGRLNFSPNVLRYSVAQRWYEEDYILSEPGPVFYGADNEAFWTRFHGEILPFLEQTLRIEPLTSIRLGDYVDDALIRLKACLKRPGRAPDLAALVLKFATDYLEEDLQAAADEIVLIGFSHGDFFTGNILRANDKGVVIDWESAGRRSISFDLYSFLFGELHRGRARVLPRSEIDHALRALESRLTHETPESPDIAARADLYRKLFYLERLLVLAERNQPDKRILRVVMRTIEVFSRHEIEASPRAPAGGLHGHSDDSVAHIRPRSSRGPRRGPPILVGALLCLASESALCSVLS